MLFSILICSYTVIELKEHCHVAIKNILSFFFNLIHKFNKLQPDCLSKQCYLLWLLCYRTEFCMQISSSLSFPVWQRILPLSCQVPCFHPPQESRLRQTCCHSILFLQCLGPRPPLGDPVEALLGSMGARALSPLCSRGCVYNASPKRRQPRQDGHNASSFSPEGIEMCVHQSTHGHSCAGSPVVLQWGPALVYCIWSAVRYLNSQENLLWIN